MSLFTPAPEEDLLKILKVLPSKSCDLDPIPTLLVKECADFLITLITSIIQSQKTVYPNALRWHMSYLPFVKSQALIEISLKLQASVKPKFNIKTH